MVLATAAPVVGPHAPRRTMLDVAALLVAALAAGVAVVGPWRRRPDRDPHRAGHLVPLGLGIVLAALAVLFADGHMPGEAAR